MGNRLQFLFILAAFLLSPFAAWGQYKVLHGTFGNGAGVRSGDHTTYDAVGQPVIGITIGSSTIVKAGFWYCAGISSTVDVAITSFFGELTDDAVLLTWSVTASTPFEGFNVYRSSAGEDAFVQINTERIAPTGETSYRDETALPGRSYLYRIGAVSREGEWSSQAITIALPPKPTTLYQNYPNPFNPSTSIAFYLPSQERVSLVIYDVRGATVRTLVNAVRPVGKHIIRWDGMNEDGIRVGSGVYYYRLKAGKDVITKKLVVVR
jgi:hypothetical protein